MTDERGSLLTPVEIGLVSKLEAARMKPHSGEFLFVSQVSRAFTLTLEGRHRLAQIARRYRSQLSLSGDEQEYIRCHAI